MTVNGHIENGKIVLDEFAPLVNGTKVRIELLASNSDEATDTEDGPTLYDQFKPIIGIVKDLPPDFARNHDHYLHGQPKK